MSASPKQLLSPEQYLAVERASPIKHEYYRGEMFAMAGASRAHNLITFNLAAILGAQLRNRQCDAYVNDMRVKIPATDLFTYPDVVVTCEQPRFEDNVLDTLVNPQVIIEVVSDSTESYDRGKKFEHYRCVELLREYLLVAQDRAHIDRYVRGDYGLWALNDADGLTSVLDLPTIACQLRLQDIYAKVELPPIDAINRADRIFGPHESR